MAADHGKSVHMKKKERNGKIFITGSKCTTEKEVFKSERVMKIPFFDCITFFQG